MTHDTRSLSAPSNFLVPSVAFLLIGLVGAAPAHGQNALGDGQALDANPRVGGGGRNMPGVIEDFRARNRIVTGEVGGGREFRGEVGYVGDRAFTAPLPSDDLFRFRADSAASSFQSIMSGTSFDRFNLAASGGVFAYDRDFTAPRAGDPVILGRAAIVPERVDLDASSRASSVGRLFERSSSSPIGAPVLIEGQMVAAFGGPVTGLRWEGMPGGQMPRTDLPMIDVSMIIDEHSRNVAGQRVTGAPFHSSLSDPERHARAARGAGATGDRIDGRTDDRVDAAIRDELVAGSLREGAAMPGDRITGDRDYDAIVRRIVEQYGDDPTVTFTGEGAAMESLRRQIDALRDRLETHVDPFQLPSISDRLAAEMAAAEAAEPAREPDAQAIADAELNERLLRALQHGRQIDELTPAERTRFADVMSRGEGLLGDGQYMLAESAFDRALRMVPKHPKALAGLVNTQVGAGLYLSAAVNLHQLLAAHPEMIDVRYGERILPSAGRIEIAVGALRNRIARSDRTERADFGLLLAYLGHQTENRELVREGLDAMRAADPDGAMTAVLEAIWLDRNDAQNDAPK